MKCSLVHQLRDALAHAGGRAVDTDHGWTVSFEDVSRRSHRLVVRYTRLGSNGLDVDAELHTGERSVPLQTADRADDYLTFAGSSGHESVTLCVTTGAWPVADARRLSDTALVGN